MYGAQNAASSRSGGGAWCSGSAEGREGGAAASSAQAQSKNTSKHKRSHAGPVVVVGGDTPRTPARVAASRLADGVVPCAAMRCTRSAVMSSSAGTAARACERGPTTGAVAVVGETVAASDLRRGEEVDVRVQPCAVGDQPCEASRRGAR